MLSASAICELLHADACTTGEASSSLGEALFYQPGAMLIFYARDAIEVFNYAQEKESISPPSILVGPQLARVNLKMVYHVLTIKVGFLPGGMYRCG